MYKSFLRRHLGMLHMEALAKLRRSAPHLEFPALHKELFSVDGSWFAKEEQGQEVEQAQGWEKEWKQDTAEESLAEAAVAVTASTRVSLVGLQQQ